MADGGRGIRRIAINTDGQVLEADHCRYEVLPRAVRVLIPGEKSELEGGTAE